MNSLFDLTRTILRQVLRPITLFAFGLATGFVMPVPAQTNAPSTLSSNRFLFVLDTSAVMKRKLPDTLKEVDQILGTAASGQLHDGDTVGLWTFNQDVYAEFPLQTWGKVSPSDLSLLIKSFMQHQRFTNSAHIDKALREMFGVISASDVITVVFVYGGQDIIKGTPFDLQINRYLKANVKPSAGKGVPMVVVLEAKGGAIFDYAVTASPWPVEFPALPQPVPLPDVKAVPPPVADTVKPPVPVAKLPPLILSGHQSSPAAPPLPPQILPVVPAEKTAQPPVSENSPPAPSPEALPPVSPPAETAATPATPMSPVIPATVPQTTMPPVSEPPPKSNTVPALANETPSAVPTSQSSPSQQVSSSAIPTDTASNAPLNSVSLADAVLPASPRPVGFLVAGVALAVVGAGLIVFMLKRPRNKAGASFISRSIGAKK